VPLQALLDRRRGARPRRPPQLDRQRRTLRGDDIVLSPAPEAPTSPEPAPVPSPPAVSAPEPAPASPRPASPPLPGVTSGDVDLSWRLDSAQPDPPDEPRSDDPGQALGVEPEPEPAVERPADTSTDARPATDRWSRVRPAWLRRADREGD
jgi:hypothetical protein